MKSSVIGASAAAVALTALIPSALANRSQDIYWSCWKQADYVRPALDPRGKEGWVANCVANATPSYNGRHHHSANPNY
jgi:hypothetical protein